MRFKKRIKMGTDGNMDAIDFSKYVGTLPSNQEIDDPKANATPELDHFFKSLAFQIIFDHNFNRDERDILLVVFRNTLHYSKVWDRISVRQLSSLSGVGVTNVRKGLKSLQAKAILDIRDSMGGGGKCRKKFSAFRLSHYFMDEVDRKYRSAKRNHGKKN